MRLKGRQFRFVVSVVGGWAALRIVMLSGDAIPDVTAPGSFTPHTPLPAVRVSRGGFSSVAIATLTQAAKDVPANRNVSEPPVHPEAGPLPPPSGPPQQPEREEILPSQPPPAAPPSPRSTTERWAVSAYAFVRPGGGRASLAAGGQLGGSQLAARVTYRVTPDLAASARAYAPLGAKGAEAAAGLDWQLLPGARISVERRVALDQAGRNAWSAYGAGGFYRERRGLVIDGYAQAGMVGARRRDLFADGAVRAGRRLSLGSASIVAGAGLWGAAQPGVARLDAGPRLTASLPVAGHNMSVAAEGRFRIAGRASPGSGAALTIGFDL